MVCEVFVVGVGMGNPATLTQEAVRALRGSGLVVGSARLLQALGGCDARTVALVDPARIAAELVRAPESVASVVMSGDVGFYSGATRLYEYLEGMRVTTVPGVSSLSYLCARLRLPWQDVAVVSAHGRDCDVAGAVQAQAKTFVLTGGTRTAQAVCAELAQRGLGGLSVAVGERLSYDDERIVRGTAAELADENFDALSVMLVLNDRPIGRVYAGPSLTDGAFERGRVPMTKEEVRELVICKLRIRPQDVVWDVGAGTGSVSVEAAFAASRGQVLAVERDQEALALLGRNRERFGLTNLRVVAGEAPQALAGLPVPDRLFVGGSSGKLDDIVAAALMANPRLRLCVTAITLETLGAALSCVKRHGLADVDIAQVGVAKAREAGGSHLMLAANPVFVISAEGGA